MNKDRFLSYAFWTTLVIGFLIMLKVIWVSDLYGDDAVNAFRAVGWFDSFTAGQLGPFDKLGATTWWSWMSFQDAPPLSFLIQHILFTLFGVSDFVAKLPFILGTFASAIIFYISMSKLASKLAVVLGSLVHTISTYAMYAGTSGYIEGLENLFILGTIILCIFLIQKHKPVYLYLAAIVMGLALTTKYTALFLVPLFIGTLIIEWVGSVDKIKLKHYLFAAAILFSILLPVITYNIQLFKVTGHFDSAISAMVGISSSDFGPIQQRVVNTHVLDKLSDLFFTLLNVNSPAITILFFCALGFLVFSLFIKKSHITVFCLLNVFFFVLMMGFLGGGRYVIIILPIMAITITWATHNILILYAAKQDLLVKIFYVALIFLCIFETFYSINSHILIKPLGEKYVFYNLNRMRNFGFSQLESYIRKEVYPESFSVRGIKSKNDLNYTEEQVRGRNVLFYDDRINWFSQLWYFSTRQIYYKLPVISSSYFGDSAGAKSTEGGSLSIDDWLLVSGKSIFFVFAGNEAVLDSIRKNDIDLTTKASALLESVIKNRNVTQGEIKDDEGNVAFIVYRIDQPK